MKSDIVSFNYKGGHSNSYIVYVNSDDGKFLDGVDLVNGSFKRFLYSKISNYRSYVGNVLSASCAAPEQLADYINVPLDIFNILTESQVVGCYKKSLPNHSIMKIGENWIIYTQSEEYSLDIIGNDLKVCMIIKSSGGTVTFNDLSGNVLSNDKIVEWIKINGRKS